MASAPAFLDEVQAAEVSESQIGSIQAPIASTSTANRWVRMYRAASKFRGYPCF